MTKMVSNNRIARPDSTIISIALLTRFRLISIAGIFSTVREINHIRRIIRTVVVKLTHSEITKDDIPSGMMTAGKAVFGGVLAISAIPTNPETV